MNPPRPSVEPSPEGGPLRRFKDPSYRPLCADLAEVRANIDRLDRQIVTLLAERGRYVKDAARFKADSFQVAAPQRQARVFAQVRDLAVAAGAYPDVVEATYRAMVAAFIAQEQADFETMEPADRTAPVAPDAPADGAAGKGEGR